MIKPLLRILLAIVILSLNPGSTGYGAKLEEEKVTKSVDTHAFILYYECRGGPSDKNLTAYWDHKGYSIGCGTPSFEGEKITKKEALRRFYEYTYIRVGIVKKDFPKANANQQTALISLASNNGTCYSYFKKNGVQKSTWLKCDKIRKDGILTPLRGLTLRRQAEVNLYFQK